MYIYNSKTRKFKEVHRRKNAVTKIADWLEWKYLFVWLKWQMRKDDF